MTSKKRSSSIRAKSTKDVANSPLINMLYDLLAYMHTNVQSINTSKMFAGCMIITLNIASKFVTIKLSKTVESYLKHSFSRDALIFAIAWVGSRDIYTSCVILIIFIICMDFIFNEESAYCILPKAFCNYHVNLLETDGTSNEVENIVTPEDIQHANEVLERAKIQSDKINVSDPSAIIAK